MTRSHQEMENTADELAERLSAVVELVEAELGVALTDEDLRGDLPYVLQVFLHEACHAALGKRVPSLREPCSPELDLVAEVMVLLLEDELGTRLGLPIHTVEEHVREIAALTPPVQVSADHYRHLQRKWREIYWPAQDLAGMCRYALAYLFPKRDQGLPADRV